MSSTRRVQPGERRTQYGYASALEFESLRGLNGTQVALKAKLLDDPNKRQLLLFLQSLTLRDGGLPRLASEFRQTFPERIGTPTMVEIGCHPGKRLSQAQRDEIDEELHGGNSTWDLLHSERNPEREHCQLTADDFCNECQELAQRHLEEFIERLCCDPRLAVSDDREELSRYMDHVRRWAAAAECEEQSRSGFEMASLYYFNDVLDALFEFQRRYEKAALENHVETSITRRVFEALDYALETGTSALLEGDSGMGKTEGLEAWHEAHRGAARLVRLKGICTKTGFFREVAEACGVARGLSMKASEIQARVQQFLKRTKAMLIFDEAQYLLPPGNRVSAPPELINWLLTACYNEHVPFVLAATSEFRERRAIVENNTTWNSFQLRRRLGRQFAIPAEPTEEDLNRVAQNFLPGASRAMIDYVVGYAAGSKGFFQTIRNATQDARLIAKRAGRAEIRYSDLKTAIEDWRAPSDAALQRVFESKPVARRHRRSAPLAEAESVPDLPPVEAPLNRLSRPVNPADRRQISLVPSVAAD